MIELKHELGNEEQGGVYKKFAWQRKLTLLPVNHIAHKATPGLGLVVKYPACGVLSILPRRRTPGCVLVQEPGAFLLPERAPNAWSGLMLTFRVKDLDGAVSCLLNSEMPFDMLLALPVARPG